MADSAIDRMRAAAVPRAMPCKACDTLPPDILEALNAGLTEDLPIAAMVRWLGIEGYPLSDTGIVSHRRKHVP